jgi:hypothetical protein
VEDVFGSHQGESAAEHQSQPQPVAAVADQGDVYDDMPDDDDEA